VTKVPKNGTEIKKYYKMAFHLCLAKLPKQKKIAQKSLKAPKLQKITRIFNIYSRFELRKFTEDEPVFINPDEVGSVAGIQFGFGKKIVDHNYFFIPHFVSQPGV
jgi:hypothetical protein